MISVTSAFATTYRAYQYAEHRHPKNVDKSIQFIARCSPRIVCGLLFSPANTKIVYHSPSSEAQGSQWGRREARQTLSSTGERALSFRYRISPDHFQTVNRMLAPDFTQKILCIIVPNRQTASFRACLHGSAGPQESEVTRLVMG